MSSSTITPVSAPSRVRASVVAAVLAVGALASAVTVLWQPWGERDDLSYATLAAHRDAAWLGAIIDGLAIAAVGIGLGLAVCRLVRRRGAGLATAGALVAGLGGVLFAGAMVAFGTLVWYVTEPAALPADVGSAMMSYLEANLGHLAAVQMPGFLLYTVGGLLLMGALARARAVPLWLPIAYLVLTVGVFATGGVVLNVVQAAQTLVLGAVAWFVVRAR